MNDAFFKPSLNVGSFIGENSSVDTERFLLFMQAYYEWMQSTTLTLSDKTGTFAVGETILGASSGATAIVKEVKTNSIIVKLTTRTVFNYSEVIDGQTSDATATINIIKDNVGRATGNVLNYKTLETSVDKYVDYLREELYPSIPSSYYGDKRLVAQYFKDFYESKSNEQSYRFLFKLLYNENIEFYYPGSDILRVSDGNFEKTQIIRTVAISVDSRDIFLFLNKTIRGETSGVLANVVDIKKFFIGSLEIAEMTLKLVSGVFTAGETIVDINDEDLSTTIYGIVSEITVVDGGSGYEDGDVITISGNGSEAQAKVSSITESPISALTVNTIGHGYQLNTSATINNSGTGGTGLVVKVTELANTYTVTSGANTYTAGEISRISILNRGTGYFKKPTITLQDATISSLGLLSDKLITIVNAGSNYGVGNTLIFTGGAGSAAAGQIASVTETTTYDFLFEDGQRMLADGSYYDIIKNEDWAALGPIKRIELTNFGTGYTSANLPLISISTTTGSTANLIATNIQGKSANVSVDTSNNIAGIGSIRSVQITNFGINYSTANAYANTIGDGNANLVPVIAGLGIREGVWLDDDGKIDYKIIQDSYYYQDYSYVIKSGLTFQTYADTLKGIIHPAGLQPFGEIQILNSIDVIAEVLNDTAIQRMLVLIFEYLDVTSTSATLPATKLVISHADTLPGYGYNPYENLRMTAFGVYGEDWPNTAISVLESVKFSDKYSEDPAYQSITSLYINSSANLAVSGITTNLKRETFAVSGTVPILESIITTQSVTVRPEIPIILSVSNVGVSMSTVMDRELPTYVTLSELDTYGNYVRIISPTPSALDISIASSAIAPQKYASAENVISLYEVLLGDARISDIVDQQLSSLVADSEITTYADLTFESVYKNTPNVYSEYVKYAQITGTVSTSPSSISYSALTLGTYANTPVNNLYSKSIDSYSIGIDGIGTDFVTDFSPNAVFVANNEYFKVESVANTTSMYIDRSPINTLSNVIAYRVIIPTYTFTSVPTSIDEGNTETFNVTTKDVANNTTLYWTIDNVTTSSGDFA